MGVCVYACVRACKRCAQYSGTRILKQNKIERQKEGKLESPDGRRIIENFGREGGGQKTSNKNKKPRIPRLKTCVMFGKSRPRVARGVVTRREI